MPEKFILAEFETPNFTLRTLATDRETASAQLKRAWAKHAKHPSVDPHYLGAYKADIQFVEIQVGDVLLDGVPYVSGGAK